MPEGERPLDDETLTRLVAENVRAVRRLAGVTQDELARAVGVSRTSIVNIEQARQGTTIHVVYRIAYALGVSVCDLVPSPGEPRPWANLDHLRSVNHNLEQKIKRARKELDD